MVPVTDGGDSDSADLKLLLHRAVHDKYDQHRERPGWFGSPLATACVGRGLQTHPGAGEELAQIDDELERWVTDQDFDRVAQSELAALGLAAAYFDARPDDRGVPGAVADMFCDELDREIEDYERRAGERVKDPELQFFGTPLYVFCAWVGVRTFGWIDEYDTFFGTLLDDHRDPEWPDAVWLAYLEPVRLEHSGYDAEICESVRTKLQQLDLEDLDVSDLFPLLWFIEEYWPEVAERVETGAVTAIIDDLRTDAWQLLYSHYDQGNVLTDGAGNPGHTPNFEDLTFLDRVIGDAETNLTVLTETQLENRISEAHDTLIAEKESIDDSRIAEKRLKLLAGAGFGGLLAYVLWTDIFQSFPLKPYMPELFAVYLLVAGYYELECLVSLVGTTDRLAVVQRRYQGLRKFILGVLMSLVAVLIISMLNAWPLG